MCLNPFSAVTGDTVLYDILWKDSCLRRINIFINLIICIIVIMVIFVKLAKCNAAIRKKKKKYDINKNFQSMKNVFL